MENPLYVGLSRQVAMRRQLEVIANNIANLNTAGYRAERLLFEEAVAKTRGGAGAERTSFTIDRATYTDMNAGAFQQTDNPLDVAIDGDGWLTLQGPDGPVYTRDGRLRRDDQGQLVGVGGHPVLDANGQPILVPEDRTVLTIAADGVVSADDEVLARIGVVRFDNVQAMQRSAGQLFATDEAPQPAEESRLVQGRVEGSNVQGIVEMSRMMELSRDYDSVSRMINEGQELLRSAINRLGRATQA